MWQECTVKASGLWVDGNVCEARLPPREKGLLQGCLGGRGETHIHKRIERYWASSSARAPP